MEIHPIETAPKDGTWLLLFGGDVGEDAGSDDRPVVARWEVDDWLDAGWVFAHWDSRWRSMVADPTHWALLPTLDATHPEA